MRVALLLALLLALAACGGEPETAPTTTAPATTTETARVAGTTLDGERISLDEFRGKPVFVNVWSSW
jgi:ABC-type glycerol-3-phosphate transport system substrate-binding protein